MIVLFIFPNGEKHLEAEVSATPPKRLAWWSGFAAAPLQSGAQHLNDFPASQKCGSNEIQRLIPIWNLGNNLFACLAILKLASWDPFPFAQKSGLSDRYLQSPILPTEVCSRLKANMHMTKKFWRTFCEKFSLWPLWLWGVLQVCSISYVKKKELLYPFLSIAIGLTLPPLSFLN